MATTTSLGITLLEQSQAQKEVTINEAFALIDAIIKGVVLDKDLATPPGTPAVGDAYLVAASPTGAWAGKARSIAYFDQIWRFISPVNDLRIWVADEQTYYAYNGTAWAVSVPAIGNISGNAATATALQTPRTINGVAFDGTANITVTATPANLTGEVTSVGVATTVTNAAVIAKVLTGYVSGAGTVAASDTILQAIQKLNGNVALRANLSGATFTGAISATNLSGTNTGDQTITLTGDVTGSGTGSFTASIGTARVTTAMLANSTVTTAKLATIPCFRATGSTQSVASGVYTLAAFGATAFDRQSNYTNTATNFRFNAPVAGVYEFHASGSVPNTAGNNFAILLYRNGVAVKDVNYNMASANNVLPLTIHIKILLAVNDFIQVYFFQDSGSTRTFALGEFNGAFVSN